VHRVATALDGALENKVAELEAAGRTEDANTVRSDALFPVRQRRQDIMTQMAVAVQGYMALDLIRRNNLELIRGVDRAQTTTIAALRTAASTSTARLRPAATGIVTLGIVTPRMSSDCSMSGRRSAGLRPPRR